MATKMLQNGKTKMFEFSTRHFPFFIVQIIVLSVMFSGFINLFDSGKVFLSTIFVDVAYTAILLLLGIKILINPRAFNATIFYIFAFVLVSFIAIGFFNFGVENLFDQFLVLRSEVLYSFVAIFIAQFIAEEKQLVLIVKTIMWSGLALSVTGILQFMGRNLLPDYLLWPKDAGFGGYTGTDIVRSTGLIGNTIVFATVLVLVLCIWLGTLFINPNITSALCTVVILFGILTTFSRIAIVFSLLLLCISMIAFIWVNWSNWSRRIRIFVGTSVFLLILAVIASPLSQLIRNSFLIDQLLLGNNAAVQGSNQSRVLYLEKMFDAVKESPLIGQGIATQRADSIYSQNTGGIITDGAWLILAVEGGILLVLVYLVWVYFVASTALKQFRIISRNLRFIPLAFLVFTLYSWGIAAQINTGIFGKAPFVLYWTIFGVVLSLQKYWLAEKYTIIP